MRGLIWIAAALILMIGASIIYASPYLGGSMADMMKDRSNEQAFGKAHENMAMMTKASPGDLESCPQEHGIRMAAWIKSEEHYRVMNGIHKRIEVHQSNERQSCRCITQGTK